MGLQSQLNDVGSDSIPILFVALIASCVSHLRSLFSAVFSGIPRLHNHHHHHHNDDLHLTLSSNLASLIAISHHRLSLPAFHFSSSSAADEEPSSCVFCLNSLKHGDWVRQLPCTHVFHRDCLDPWLNELKFNCPLCRSPLSDCRVAAESTTRVAADLAAWFAIR